MNDFLKENNDTIPYISVHYCLDRPYLNLTLGGPNFIYFRAALDTSLTLLIIMVNTVLIIGITRYRRRFRGTIRIYNSGTSMKFVLMLAISDVLVGCTVPLYLIPHYSCYFNDYFRNIQMMCMAKYVAVVFSMVMSNLSLLAIAVDRYIAIFHTLRHRLIMTHRVCHTVIAFQILIAMGCSLILFVWNRWSPGGQCEMEDVMPHWYISILGGVCHLKILIMVLIIHYKMHQKAMESASKRNILESGGTRFMSSNAKSAHVVILVSGVYFICWTPYSICVLIRVLYGRTPLADFFFQLAFALSYANSLINPFIYAWKNGEMRSAVLWYLRR